MCLEKRCVSNGHTLRHTAAHLGNGSFSWAWQAQPEEHNTLWCCLVTVSQSFSNWGDETFFCTFFFSHVVKDENGKCQHKFGELHCPMPLLCRSKLSETVTSCHLNHYVGVRMCKIKANTPVYSELSRQRMLQWRSTWFETGKQGAAMLSVLTMQRPQFKLHWLAYVARACILRMHCPCKLLAYANSLRTHN